MAKLLDPRTLLLEYSLGEDHSYLWAIEAGHVRSFVLPPQQKIETLARQVHEELSTIEAGAGVVAGEHRRDAREGRQGDHGHHVVVAVDHVGPPGQLAHPRADDMPPPSQLRRLLSDIGDEDRRLVASPAQAVRELLDDHLGAASDVEEEVGDQDAHVSARGVARS